jgi:uncharacterized protein (UPF0333 family)
MEHAKELQVRARPYHVKEGFKTTEFWVSLLVIALATVIVGVQVRESGINVSSAVAISAAALTAIGYSRSRSHAKSGF